MQKVPVRSEINRANKRICNFSREESQSDFVSAFAKLTIKFSPPVITKSTLFLLSIFDS